MMTTNQKLLTVRGFAKYAGISPTWATKLVRKGRIPTVKVNIPSVRIWESDAASYVLARRPVDKDSESGA